MFPPTLFLCFRCFLYGLYQKQDTVKAFLVRKKKGEENELMQVNVDEVTYLQNLVISNLISIESGVDFYTGSFFGRG